jgi:hypothetical protein
MQAPTVTQLLQPVTSTPHSSTAPLAPQRRAPGVQLVAQV